MAILPERYPPYNDTNTNMQTQTNNPFAEPYLYWIRYYGRDGNNLCSWSFTATGIQSPLTCEPIYQPRGDTYQTPIAEPVAPIILVPTLPTDPNISPLPVTITPEPSTILLVMFGLLAVFVGSRFKTSRW